MAYDRPVKFTSTGNYGNVPGDEDDVYTVDEFVECCDSYAFIDDDGHGYPVKGKMADDSICIYPSNRHEIPLDATHIVWYNR